MRRTDAEFKAEVLRRSETYRKNRAQKRKKLLAVICCAVILMGAAVYFQPARFMKSGSTADCAEPESAMQMNMGSMEEADREAPAEGAADYGVITFDQAAISVRRGSEEAVELTEEDAAVIARYLEGEWIDSLMDCAVDCELVIDGVTYHYHSDCGSFQNMESNCSLTVTEEARLTINGILEKYIELGVE